MPLFYVLTIVREIPKDETLPITVKFYPQRTKQGFPLLLSAENASSAWLQLKTKPRTNTNLLAIQEKDSYDASIERAIAKRVLRGTKDQSPDPANAPS